jgi:uncharacterized membrane protein YphA (DoxX/SURF4 family)
MDRTFGITTTPSPELSIALLALRIASALAFLYPGAAITFGAFGGPGPEKFAAFMHMPLVAGYLVGLAQLTGGLAMLIGVLIRVGAGASLSSCSAPYFSCTCRTASISDMVGSSTRLLNSWWFLHYW